MMAEFLCVTCPSLPTLFVLACFSMPNPFCMRPSSRPPFLWSFCSTVRATLFLWRCVAATCSPYRNAHKPHPFRFSRRFHQARNLFLQFFRILPKLSDAPLIGCDLPRTLSLFSPKLFSRIYLCATPFALYNVGFCPTLPCPRSRAARAASKFFPCSRLPFLTFLLLVRNIVTG